MDTGKLIDKPLESETNESLGFSDHAHVLFEFIRSCETPLTIGIQGDWGIGKTSLLNMLSEKLMPDDGRKKYFPVVYLNTWQYAQFNRSDLLGVVVLRGLINEIEAAFDQQQRSIADTAKGLFSGLADAVDQIAQHRYGISVKETAQALSEDEPVPSVDVASLIREYKQQFRELVDELIQKDDGKLVIMIDDLDRLRPERALELLEVVKNFLDVPKCVFVLAIDYAVIQRGVRAKFGDETQTRHGKSFFDKIIQIPFNMPVSSYHVDRYIMSLMGWNYDEARETYRKAYTRSNGDKYFLRIQNNQLSTDTAEYFTNITRLSVGNNPRSIKRAVNYANLLRMVILRTRSESEGKEVWKLSDAKITYPLACMQLAWPELFNFFAEHPVPSTIEKLEDWTYLESLPDTEALFNRNESPQRLKSNITGFVDELINTVDTNKDGRISTEEFEPIWKIMDEANLTSVPLEDHDDIWEEFKTRARDLNERGGRWSQERIDEIVNLFRSGKSKWNNRVFFQILSAGKRFYNLLWDDQQIGSIATTQSEPAQLYLKGDAKMLEQRVSSKTRPLIKDVTGVGHYGTGDIKIDLGKVLKQESEEQIRIMNEILQEFLQLPEEPTESAVPSPAPSETVLA